MGVIKRVHHLELITKTLNVICDYFIESFGFKTVGSWNKRLVLKSGTATFLVKSSDSNILDQVEVEIDTVYDIALEVDNVNSLVEKAIKFNVEILSFPKIIQDTDGFITIAKIRSCVGNVVHTLICRENYKGFFLPECEVLNTIQDDDFSVKSFDHITFAVPNGSSDSIIKWYHDIFGMSRIKINSDDSPSEGFVVQHNEGGMRLKAFDYWKCSEIGLKNKEESCKFIIAEELSPNVPNQISTFLREHGDAGVQHVGLLVTDIENTARRFHGNGARFMSPPRQYYELINERLPIGDIGVTLTELEKYGILVDSESEDSALTDGQKYLLQAFSKPIFDRDTFFLELIERQGATGFGAGNIKALWDAVDATIRQQ